MLLALLRQAKEEGDSPQGPMPKQWLLYASIRAALLPPAEGGGPPSSNPPTQALSPADLQELLKPALALLRLTEAQLAGGGEGEGEAHSEGKKKRVREGEGGAVGLASGEGAGEGGSTGEGAGKGRERDSEAKRLRACWESALVACWRQALLLPLRSPLIDWRCFRRRLSSLPRRARATLLPELRLLCSPCGCHSLAVGGSEGCGEQEAAGGRGGAGGGGAPPHTCDEVRRRARSYAGCHPLSSVEEPIRQFLLAAKEALPPPSLVQALERWEPANSVHSLWLRSIPEAGESEVQGGGGENDGGEEKEEDGDGKVRVGLVDAQGGSIEGGESRATEGEETSGEGRDGEPIKGAASEGAQKEARRLSERRGEVLTDKAGGKESRGEEERFVEAGSKEAVGTEWVRAGKGTDASLCDEELSAAKELLGKSGEAQEIQDVGASGPCNFQNGTTHYLPVGFHSKERAEFHQLVGEHLDRAQINLAGGATSGMHDTTLRGTSLPRTESGAAAPDESSTQSSMGQVRVAVKMADRQGSEAAKSKRGRGGFIDELVGLIDLKRRRRQSAP